VKNVNVFLSPETCQTEILTQGTAVVIDVLRASSTIVTALAHGCREIYPVLEVADAFKKAAELGWQDVVLGGERGGVKVAGFDLGNSPRDYTNESVGGKKIIFTTTNGTRALLLCAKLDRTVVLSLLNFSAVLRHLAGRGSDIHILCGGQEGAESLEDSALAGLMVQSLLDSDSDYHPSAVARHVAEAFRNADQDLMTLFRSSSHGAELEKFGFGPDLEFCAQMDKYDIVPVYDHGIITRLN
jgi:2-phosphosulfolactate phosphatase